MTDFESAAFAESVRRQRPKHPDGWEPGVVWSGRGGTVTTDAIEGKPDWASVLAAFDLDPAQVEIVEPVQFRTWDAAIGNGEVRRMRYWKANVRARRASDLDVQAQIRELRRRRPAKPADRGEGTFCVVAADWQLGREGTDDTVARWGDGIADVRRRYRDLRKIGRRLGRLAFLSVGDLVEGCKGWYAQQAFTVVLNKREQVRLGRRMVLRGLTEWTPDFDAVLAGGIGGNHGENRDETGQSFTDFGDNADVEILEQAGEVAKASPALRHIEWAIPNRDLTLTVNLAGRIVALSHGHQAKGSGPSAQAKVRRWWEGQMYGGQPAGDADVLLTGHFHHYSHIRDGQTPSGDPRHHLQAPSLASGARWFTESKGTPEVPGVLTFVIDANGLRDVEVL